MSAPVFISYSSKDQNVAETIYQALEARGQQCWIASRDVRPGENYQEAIVRALRSAKVMLLIFTSNANNSDEIKKELVLAGRHRVIVVPVRVEDVVPNDAFTYELATRQWVDLFKDWERQIELLAARIGHLVSGVEPAAAELPPVRAIKKSSPGHALMWGPLAALVLVAIGAAAFYMRPAKVAAPPQQTAAQTAPLAPGAPAAPFLHSAIAASPGNANCYGAARRAAAATNTGAVARRSRMADRGGGGDTGGICRISESVSRRRSRARGGVADRRPDPRRNGSEVERLRRHMADHMDLPGRRPNARLRRSVHRPGERRRLPFPA